MGLAHGKPAGNTTDMLVRRPSSARWLDVADIPLSQLRDAIEELSVEREDGSTGFLKEFATLESRTATQHGREAHKEAKKATNVVLNRYNDVWPNDKHRVTISRNEEGTDYINASFVDSLWQRRAYIMAQGPMASTANDFWTMIWEHNVRVVVMVTQLREKEREKCFQYWPSEVDGFDNVGRTMSVKLVSEQTTDMVVERVMEVRMPSTGESRTIHHLQLMEWVDHGVPTSFAPFRMLVMAAEKHNDGKAPMLVHCSAGIGRSGVFCAVHSIWKNVLTKSIASATVASTLNAQIVPPPTVNVLSTVSQMRSFRPGAVQTPEQYEFIYRAIDDFVALPNFGIGADESASERPDE